MICHSDKRLQTIADFQNQNSLNIFRTAHVLFSKFFQTSHKLWFFVSYGIFVWKTVKSKHKFFRHKLRTKWMGSLLLEDTTQFHMSEFESVLISHILTNHLRVSACWSSLDACNSYMAQGRYRRMKILYGPRDI